MSTEPEVSDMGTIPSTTLDLVGCPQCGAPAEVVDRFVLQSTDGPLEYAKVGCVLRHWFTVAVESLASAPGASSREREGADRWTPDTPRT